MNDRSNDLMALTSVAMLFSFSCGMSFGCWLSPFSTGLASPAIGDLLP